MQVPQRKSQAFRKYGQETDNYITAEAIEMLKGELSHLETVSRPKTVVDLTKAREMGDLSENAAYHMAKGRLGGIDYRIAEIKDKLKNAILIEKGANDKGEVKIGSTVTVEINGRERIFEITGSQETNPGSGKISHQSPVGKALLNHKAGEKINITGASGNNIEYKILKVE